MCRVYLGLRHYTKIGGSKVLIQLSGKARSCLIEMPSSGYLASYGHKWDLTSSNQPCFSFENGTYPWKSTHISHWYIRKKPLAMDKWSYVNASTLLSLFIMKILIFFVKFIFYSFSFIYLHVCLFYIYMRLVLCIS